MFTSIFWAITSVSMPNQPKTARAPDAWRECLIPPSAPIRKAIQRIDTSDTQITLVVDQTGRLLGTVTDGDIRRGILKGVSLDGPVESVMNLHPVTGGPSDDRKSLLAIMQKKKIHQIPVIDADRRVTGLTLLDELLKTPDRSNWVLLMAGGVGQRLQPLTNDRPKPLIHVGNKPILETILENFLEYGFKEFYMAVNYKNEMVMEHFGDGAKWGVEIRYIKESKKMGTAGALGLLPVKPKVPVIVMNGDLLTNINFDHLLRFHAENGADGTMAVREYDFQVPYGVVNMDGLRIKSLDEKPVKQFFVNAGIYVISPAMLKYLPKGKPHDMTQLFETMIAKKHAAAAFPIREYWLDIGQLDDLKRAKGDFSKVFG